MPHRPLFEIDPGWIFVIAGLTLCVAGVLIPAQRDLHDLRIQLDVLRERERTGNERLRAHAEFIADLDHAPANDTALTRRLAASQLNIIPEGDVPVIVAASQSAVITDWIEARAIASSASSPRSLSSPPAYPDSILTRLATGPRRLWLLGGGVLAVFVGLVLAPPYALRRFIEPKEKRIMLNDAHSSDVAETSDTVEIADSAREEPCYEIVTVQQRADQPCAAD